jgi:hypothetical protein
MGARTYLIGFISLEAVQGEFVFLSPNCDSFNAQFVGRPKNADGYFRTVCD